MGVAQQVRHERIGVDDFPGVGVEDQDAVLGRLEQPPIPDFGSLHGDFRPLAFGDVLDGKQDQVRLAVHRRNRRALSSMIFLPIAGKSCSTSKS